MEEELPIVTGVRTFLSEVDILDGVRLHHEGGWIVACRRCEVESRRLELNITGQ